MEAAVRWSPYSTADSQRFLIADVAASRFRYCELKSVSGKAINYRELSSRDRLPNYTAFDWSRNDEDLVAIGTVFGETRVLRLSPSGEPDSQDLAFPIRQQRKCNSVAFSKSDLLASAYDKHRADYSLNIYDIKNSSTGSEPLRKLSSSDIVANVKFFSGQPDILLAGVLPPKGAFLRLYDLRDSNSIASASFVTRHCHFLSIDPLDENYFASAGPTGDNVISIWDRRLLARSSAANPSIAQPGAVLEIRPAVSESVAATIWSLRYSGYRRGCFAVLSSAAELRLFETARYPPLGSDSDNDIYLSHGDDVTHFTRRCHNLQSLWADRSAKKPGETRTLAFDFAGPGSLVDGDSVISIRHDKTLEVVEIPPQPSCANISTLNDLVVFEPHRDSLTAPENRSTVAEDLLIIQGKIAEQLAASGKSSQQNGGEVSAITSALQRSRIDQEIMKTSSRQRHEHLLAMGGRAVKLDMADMLTVMDAQRRRCLEGYLFNCDRNKEIVRNDPWLVDLWDSIKRMQDMTNNGGMLHEALDLSYLGVYNIWNAKLGPNPGRISRSMANSESRPSSTPEFTTALKTILSRQGYDSFKGVETEFPHHRQLCLAICGWKFSENSLRAKCEEILARGEHYKAITVAVCHGRKDVAIELLKSATRNGVIETSALAAIIAIDPISKEQRSLCEWMVDEAKDPYLKALLTYFVTSSWAAVIDMKELPLLYRVALVLKYYSDSDLDTFLTKATREAIAQGDTEGIILTGLAEDSMELFQTYIAKSSDLQTAVLATALTNPRYVQDQRWPLWKETYFMQMQSWRAFIERSRFTSHHNRMSITRDGRRMIKPRPRNVALRCNHCQKSIARRSLDDDDDTATLSSTTGSALGNSISNIKTPASSAGTVCPRCGRPMPRCSICMLWLGSPDPSKPPGAAALSEAAMEDALAKFVVFCMSCNHGFHENHARMWFAKHPICPVPDCECSCSLRSG